MRMHAQEAKVQARLASALARHEELLQQQRMHHAHAEGGGATRLLSGLALVALGAGASSYLTPLALVAKLTPLLASSTSLLAPLLLGAPKVLALLALLGAYRVVHLAHRPVGRALDAAMGGVRSAFGRAAATARDAWSTLSRAPALLARAPAMLWLSRIGRVPVYGMHHARAA